MPRFAQDDMDTHSIGGSTFQFSAKKIESLGATEYTLAVLVIDRSGSTDGFEEDIDAAVKVAVQGCRKSPRADNLMLRVIIFDHEVIEFHGFKPLPDCNEADYDRVCIPRGTTALRDAVYSAVKSAMDYGQQLVDNVVTDGMDNASDVSDRMVADALRDARRTEALESIMPVLIGVGIGAAEDESDLSDYLKRFKDDAGFQQYIFIGSATSGKLAKLGGFISESISSQSQALGSGGASASLSF